MQDLFILNVVPNLASYPVCTASAISYRGIYPNYHYYDADGGIMEGDYFRMECIVAYSGGYWPVTNGGNRSDGGGGYSESRNIKKSSTATRLTARDNGLTFTMKTTFERKYNFEPRANEAIATNVPPYQHLWKFKVNVLCKYEFLFLVLMHYNVSHEVTHGHRYSSQNYYDKSVLLCISTSIRLIFI